MSRPFRIRDPRIEAGGTWPWRWYVCWLEGSTHHARGCVTHGGAVRRLRRLRRRMLEVDR